MCFNDCNEFISVYTSLTSLHNGFVDSLMKYKSCTRLCNGFVDSGDMMLQPGEAPDRNLGKVREDSLLHSL